MIPENQTRTYAYFDLIGTKEALKEGRNPQEKLEKYWTALKEATKQAHSGRAPVYSKRYNREVDEAVEPVVRVWSDSALLWMNNELVNLADFYMVVEAFLRVLRNFEVSVYCIINRDTESHTPDLFEHTGYSDPPRISFEFGPGTGAAWANIYLADLELQNRKDWFKQYYFYCIGQENLPGDYEVKDRFSFKGLGDEKRELLAIEKKT